MKLKTPTGASRAKTTHWCGPYALAVMTGMGYDDAYKAACEAAKRRWLKGLTIYALRAAARKAGVPFQWTSAKNRTGKRACPTLADFRSRMQPGCVILIQVTDHYLIVNTHDWTWIDNQVCKWLPLGRCKHRLKRVQRFAEITPLAGAIMGGDGPAAALPPSYMLNQGDLFAGAMT